MKKTIRLTETELKTLIKSIVSEALKPSQFRKYVNVFNKERYSDIFKMLGNRYSHDKNYYRIYIPLEGETSQGPVSETEKRVKSFLEKNGYKDIDYIKGTCRYGDSKNLTTIGKALTRLKNNELMNKFVSDESRKAVTSDVSNLMVVISRHPYDIAGSDTDRNWTNCMTIGHGTSSRVKKLYDELRDLETKFKMAEMEYMGKPGIIKLKPSVDFKYGEEKWGNEYEHTEEYLSSDLHKILQKIDDVKDEIKGRKEEGSNVMYILNEVKEGALISYLIRKDDKNIQNPLAVLNIKPYVNKSNNSDFILASDNTTYGQGRPEFKQTVDSILKIVNGNKTGFYCLKSGMYSDNPSNNIVLMDKSQKEFIDLAHKKIMEKLNSDFIIKNVNRIYDEIASEQFNESLDYIESNINFDLDDENFDSTPNYSKELDELLDIKKREVVNNFKNRKYEISEEDVLDFYTTNGAFKGMDDVDLFVEDFLEMSDLVHGELWSELDTEIRAICNEYIDKVLGDNENIDD